MPKSLSTKNLFHAAGRAAADSMVTGLNNVMQRVGVDTKLQFSLEPPSSDEGGGYEQWLNAMQSVARLPDGIPHHFRKKLWLTLATHYVKSLNLDWQKTCQMAFSDRVNADDDEMGMQIIKDLHRTGWSGLAGEQERIVLKRVLLAYARFNKHIGYCQGFNVIAALILDVVDYKETDAFKVMILFLEHVLPPGYFDHTLRALSVDMAVLGELMHQRLPTLARHLESLQKSSASDYEPPVTNVFTMQWLLTLYATCLPRWLVLRVWDALLIDGSEILLRTSLAIWARIAKRVGKTKSADEFYSVMGSVCQQLLQMSHSDCNHLMQIIYTMAEFPYPGLAEMRERYTWNIQPFTSGIRHLRSQLAALVNADSEDEHDTNNRCLAATLMPTADKICASAKAGAKAADLSALQKQYKQLKQRQKQAAIILQNAYSRGQQQVQSHLRSGSNSAVSTPIADTPGSLVAQTAAFNHLYVTSNSPQNHSFATMNGVVPLQSKTIQPSGRCVRRTSQAYNPQDPTSSFPPSMFESRDRQTSECSAQSTRCPSETTIRGSWSPRSSTSATDVNDASQLAASFCLRRTRSCPAICVDDSNRRSTTIIGNLQNFKIAISAQLQALDLQVDVSKLPELNSVCSSTSHVFAAFNERISGHWKNVSTMDGSCTSSLSATAKLKTKIAHTAIGAKSTATQPPKSNGRRTNAGQTRHSGAAASTKRHDGGTQTVKFTAPMTKPTNFAPAPIFNPFPTKHTSRLIAREKKLGLY